MANSFVDQVVFTNNDNAARTVISWNCNQQMGRSIDWNDILADNMV
jgi:hypothetical protein